MQEIVCSIRTPEYSLRCSVPGPPKIGGLSQPCMVPITKFQPLERGSIVPSTTEFWVHKVMFDVIFHRNSGVSGLKEFYFIHFYPHDRYCGNLLSSLLPSYVMSLNIYAYKNNNCSTVTSSAHTHQHC
jgi:hypothetical protein